VEFIIYDIEGNIIMTMDDVENYIISDLENGNSFIRITEEILQKGQKKYQDMILKKQNQR
jgi:hypothetical protein